MKIGNDISDKQNTKEILDLLFSARFYMNRAGKLKKLELLIMIFIVILSLFKLEIEEVILKNNIISIDIIVLSLIGISKLIISFRKKSIDIGADIKQYIDCELYGLQLNKEEIGLKNIIEMKNRAIKNNKKYYEEQITNKGSDKIREVKEWYCVNNSFSKYNAIVRCQSENNYWDERLTNKYEKFIMSIFIFMFLVVGLSSLTYIGKILFGIAYGADLYNERKEILECNKIILKTKILLDGFQNIKEKEKWEEIKKIQNLLYKRRKLTIVPDYFHKISTVDIHKNIREFLNKN